MTQATRSTVPETAAFRPTDQEVAFFETFGFVRFPGLFADDIDRITSGFEDVFADEAQNRMDVHEDLHLSERRVIIPGFIHRSEKLAPMVDDPRVVAIVDALFHDDWEYAESDGNLFYCESSWHPDTYSAPLTRMHLKLSFYLDSLSGENGAIRMIPGTNHHTTPYANELRTKLSDPLQIEDIFGVPYNEIPSWTLASEPGDVIVWNFRTIHASLNGGERRRLFSINFRKQHEDPGADKIRAAMRAQREA